MRDGYDTEEEDLQHRQGGQLYPIGRSLRSTFSPPDGEELQPKITSLMVELSHQPYESMPYEIPARYEQKEAAHPSSPPSIREQLARFFRRH